MRNSRDLKGVVPTSDNKNNLHEKYSFYGEQSIVFWQRPWFVRKILAKLRLESPFIYEGIDKQLREIGFVEKFTLYSFSDSFRGRTIKKKIYKRKFNKRIKKFQKTWKTQYKFLPTNFWKSLTSLGFNFTKDNPLNSFYLRTLKNLMLVKYGGSISRAVDFDLLKYAFMEHNYPLLPFFYNQSLYLVFNNMSLFLTNITKLNKFNNEPNGLFMHYKLFLTYINMFYYKKRTYNKTAWFFFKKYIPLRYAIGNKWALDNTHTIAQRAEYEKKKKYIPLNKIAMSRRNFLNIVTSRKNIKQKKQSKAQVKGFKASLKKTFKKKVR